MAKNLVSGLEVFNKSRFNDKLRDFGAAGLSSVHFVLDFDYTLTTLFTADGDRASSSWGVLERHLPPAAQKECQDMHDYYVVKERAGTLTIDEAETWWAKALAVQRDNQVNLMEVEANFMYQANIRPGTHELFDELNTHAIPSIILSAGIKNVIDIWCAAYKISPSLVVSTELTTDKKGRMTGWNTNSVIHALNKDEADHPEMSQLKEGRPYTILLGDSIHDAQMAAGDDTVIRIRIVDTQPDTDMVEVAGITSQAFDAMITNTDLLPVVALLQRIKSLQTK